MDIEHLIVLVVKAVIEELRRQGLIEGGDAGQGARPVESSSPSSVPPGRARRVITAQTVLEAAKTAHKTLEVPPGGIITPLARDTAKERGVVLRGGRPR